MTTRTRPAVPGTDWASSRRARFASTAPRRRRSLPDAGDQAGTAFDPIAGGGACATAPGADQAGTASYRLDPRPARRLHADGLADDRRRHQLAEPDVADRGPPARRRPRAPATRRWSPAASTGPRSIEREPRAGLPAPPERLEVRRGPRREARAAAGGPALRPRLERPGAGRPSPTSSCACRCSSSPGRWTGSCRTRRRRSCRPATTLAARLHGAAIRGRRARRLSGFRSTPAFEQCTSPNDQHGAPLAFGSCSPPQPGLGLPHGRDAATRTARPRTRPARSSTR